MTSLFSQHALELGQPPRVKWEKDDNGDEYVSNPEIAGPFAWAQIHAWAQNLHDHVCPSCGVPAIKMVSAMHDVVNAKLGKPIHDRDAMAWMRDALDKALGGTPQADDAEMGQLSAWGQHPDKWGSRCRDLAGRWIPSADCGTAPPDGEIAISRKTFAVGANGLTRYDLEHRIVDVMDLRVSHDPHTFAPRDDYPSELQPRLRERAATRLQVEKISANIEPGVLLTDFHVLDRGSPIIGPDMVVESGNGRVMALQRAVTDNPEGFAAYVAQLADSSASFGVEDDAIGVRSVLVRVRLTEVNRQAFAEEANTGATIAASAIEQARTDAGKITVAMLQGIIVGDSQSIEDALRSRTNRQFVQRFLQVLPDTEQARLVDKQGVLNQDGVRRAVLAIFVSAFPGDAGLRLAEKAFESIDLDVRNVVNALSRSLGVLANAEAQIREGNRPAELAIGDDLAEATQVFASIKRTPGLSVADYLAQQQLFERELTEFQELVLITLDTRSRSARKMADVFKAYAEIVLETPPPAQGGFFEAEPVDKEATWRRAVKRSESASLVAAQKDPKDRIDWCNMTDRESAEAWGWRPLREILLTVVGLKAPVWICTAGFAGDQIQATVDTAEISRRDEDNLAGAFTRLGAKRVVEFGVRRLIFEITLPAGELAPEDLLGGTPQAVHTIPKRDPGVQGSLFQELGLAQDDLHQLGPDAMELDAAGKGKYVTERVADPDDFDPDSFRTKAQGDHRVRVGCPEGHYTAGKPCGVGTRAQAVLHPRSELDQLVIDADARGIPHNVTAGDEAFVEEVRSLVAQVADEVVR